MNAANYDRIDNARAAHRRDRKQDQTSKCVECRMPWPCVPAVLVQEVDLQAKEIRRLKQKPQIEPLTDARPRVPRMTAWTWGDLRRHARWMQRAWKKAEEYADTVLIRADRDADDGNRSVTNDGGGRPPKSDDGTNPGPTQRRVLSMERVNKATGQVTWEDGDAVTPALVGLLVAYAQGDAEGVLKASEDLYGLPPELIAQIVDPKPGRCENENCRKFCTGELDDRRIIDSGDGLMRCEACSRWSRRKGTERPEENCKASQAVEVPA